MLAVTTADVEPSPPVTLWLLSDQVPFAQRLLIQAGTRCTRAGCPVKGQNVAASFGADPFDDLRAELASPTTGVFILLTTVGFGEGDTAIEDLHRIAAAASGGHRVRVLTLDPIPERASDLARVSGSMPSEAFPRLLGLPSNSLELRSGTEWLESLEGVRAASLWCAAAGVENTLAGVMARLFDLLILTMGEPESIDAAFVLPRTGRALHAAPGESLHSLSGCMALVARFGDGRAASLFGAEGWPKSGFSAKLVGSNGQMTLEDGVCTWFGGKGDTQRWGEPKHAGASEIGWSLERQIAAEIAEALSESSAVRPAPLETILLMAQAALLSARTGQPEALDTIRIMNGSR